MKPSVLLLLGMRAWHSDIQEPPEVHYEPSYPQWYGVRSTAMPTGQVKRTSLGRPRKPAEDAKSIRRAQVREAQQAYRSRQQSQLSSLKARVEQLEDVLNQLSQTVHAFDNQLIQHGSQWSQPQLLQTVQLLRDDIMSHFKRADIHFQESTEDQPSELSQAVNEQPHALVASEVSAGRLKDHTSGSDFWKLFLGSSAGIIPSTNTQNLDNQSNNLVSIPVAPSIAETHTIQYATTPFTQRLFRACAESGHRFLSNLSYKDEDMWEFGLLLQRMPRAEIQRYFGRVIDMEPCNPIVDGRFPYVSLGGAGTHFLQPSSDSFSDSFALFRTANGVSHVPADEDWFDVHDVERYLLNKGIIAGEFPSALTISYPFSPDARPSNLEIPQGELPGGVMMVIDEYKLINRLSQLPVALGCVAGFRRSDVERVVSHNVRWISVGFTGSTG
ncbi:hypothetical protein CBS147333_2296 [Penicillium roqueforti]|nr:hypothetical protein CBS147354_343 [Penicillium roqueforti]KAI3114061.1 hypothetical protein CBS147333_2296 [Penicillium roqueforti]KAI3142779.1 hypothetical protein CBS147330_566 [Penicillium roqueforti]KAI3278757.1 hypothetical protein CBS147308_98 [Penicillium roqueforti]KAI3295757.1 hypothetical protein DTO003C3_2065 [Penicillium roqueforti]